MNRFKKTRCEEIINKLISFPICYPFLQLIDPERDGAPDYYQFVSKPMALVEVKRKLSEDKYKTVQEFKDDVELIWANARAYNGEGTLFTDMALEAKYWFDKKMKHFPDTIEQEWTEKVLSVSKRLFKLTAHPPPEVDPTGELKITTQSDDELNDPLPPPPPPPQIPQQTNVETEKDKKPEENLPQTVEKVEQQPQTTNPSAQAEIKAE